MESKIEIVSAMTLDRVIGLNNDLPWRGKAPGELKLFKELTMGHSLLTGATTYDSIPPERRPLKGRYNIVLSRKRNFEGEDVLVCRSLDEALEKANAYEIENHDSEERRIFIGGGAEIYKQTLEKADAMWLTYIDGKYSGDTFFPKFELSSWNEVKEDEVVREIKEDGVFRKIFTRTHYIKK